MQPQAPPICQEHTGTCTQSPAFQCSATQYCPQPTEIHLTKALTLAAPQDQHHASPENTFILSQRSA